MSRSANVSPSRVLKRQFCECRVCVTCRCCRYVLERGREKGNESCGGRGLAQRTKSVRKLLTRPSLRQMQLCAQCLHTTERHAAPRRWVSWHSPLSDLWMECASPQRGSLCALPLCVHHLRVVRRGGPSHTFSFSDGTSVCDIWRPHSRPEAPEFGEASRRAPSPPPFSPMVTFMSSC